MVFSMKFENTLIKCKVIKLIYYRPQNFSEYRKTSCSALQRDVVPHTKQKIQETWTHLKKGGTICLVQFFEFLHGINFPASKIFMGLVFA